MIETQRLRKPDAWVGIDQSYSGFGLIVITDDGSHTSNLWKFPPQNSDGARLNEIRVTLLTKFKELKEQNRTVTVVMEGYASNAKFGREKLGELGGIVKLSHFEVFGRDPHVIPPTSLKKFVTGKGNAKKEEVIAAVESRWKAGIKNNNLADAYGLARYASDGYV